MELPATQKQMMALCYDRLGPESLDFSAKLVEGWIILEYANSS